LLCNTKSLLLKALEIKKFQFMNFIVIEGLDGAGKSTQIKLIEEYLIKKGIKSKFIHFPRTTSPVYGELISRFLRGGMGDINSVDPYLIALIYAGDRMDASAQLQQWMDEGYVIIADRYLYSNIAFQCAKLKEQDQINRLSLWIKNLEYNYNKIPVPDLNLFLNVPFEFTKMSLENNRNGSDREYLQGAEDIHEADLGFQKRVRDIYLWQIQENEDFIAVECSDNQGKMLPPELISEKIINLVNLKI
jgi:dTMP kinase